MAHKRKPSNTAPAPAKPSCRPRHDSPDHEEDEATEPELTDPDNDNPADRDTAYEETKALGDADREVSAPNSSHFILSDALQRP
jgi:hypothetical protein